MSPDLELGGAIERRPTLANVADAAGVSLKTASRALNGEPYVAEATRTRVLEAAAALDFRMNAAASQLKRGQDAATVGLIIGDLTNPFSMAVAKGAEIALRTTGQRLLIASSDEDADTERALVAELVQQHVSGILLVSTLADHTAFVPLAERGVRFVFIDRPPVGLAAPSVVLDNVGGTTRAIEALLRGGHRRIAFVGDHARLSPHSERRAAYRAVLAAHGLPIAEELVRGEAHDAVAGAATVSELLRLPDPPTAIFAANNLITIGALSALNRSGSTAALVGFDDFELADAVGVTTVSSDLTALGRAAVDLLRAYDPVSRVVLPAQLVARGSGER